MFQCDIRTLLLVTPANRDRDGDSHNLPVTQSNVRVPPSSDQLELVSNAELHHTAEPGLSKR